MAVLHCPSLFCFLFFFNCLKVRTPLPGEFIFHLSSKFFLLERILNPSSQIECHSVHVKLFSISTAVGVNLHLLHLPSEHTVLHPRWGGGGQNMFSREVRKWLVLWQSLFLGSKPVTVSQVKNKLKKEATTRNKIKEPRSKTEELCWFEGVELLRKSSGIRTNEGWPSSRTP